MAKETPTNDAEHSGHEKTAGGDKGKGTFDRAMNH